MIVNIGRILFTERPIRRRYANIPPYYQKVAEKNLVENARYQYIHISAPGPKIQLEVL